MLSFIIEARGSGVPPAVIIEESSDPLPPSHDTSAWESIHQKVHNSEVLTRRGYAILQNVAQSTSWDLPKDIQQR